MPVCAHPQVGAATDGVAEGGQKIGQDGYRVGLAVGFYRTHDVTRQAVVRFFVERGP